MGKKLLVAGNNAPKSVVEKLQAEGYELITLSAGMFKDESVFSELFAGEQAKSFANAEKIKGADVVFVQSTAASGKYSQNDNAMMALSIANTVKRYGASTVTAVLPFAPYERQDVRKSTTTFPSLMGELFPQLLKTAGADKVLTYSPHSHKAVDHWKEVFGNCYFYTANSSVLAGEIMLLSQRKDFALVVGAPDGSNKPQDMAQEQARLVSKALKGAAMFFIEKIHTGVNDTQVSGFEGDVNGKDCVIIDDMSDTGGTGKNAAKALWQKGANSVTFSLGHALVSEEALADMLSAKVPGNETKKLFTHLVFTDSCPDIYRKIQNLKSQYPDIEQRITVVETGFSIARSLSELEKVQVPSAGRAK